MNLFEFHPVGGFYLYLWAVGGAAGSTWWFCLAFILFWGKVSFHRQSGGGIGHLAVCVWSSGRKARSP